MYLQPQNLNEAKFMLHELSGNTHEVISGICVHHKEQCISKAVTTSVKFKDQSAEEINHYVDTYLPLDKAGAYGIQEWIGFIGINYIKGSFYNVMGLPVKELYEAIKEF